MERHHLNGRCLEPMSSSPTQVPELFLKTEEEYRFLVELKRLSGDAALINDDTKTGFEFGNYKVIFENGKIILLDQDRQLSDCMINDFIHHPNAQFRNLMRAMRK